jgi:succinate dehydrogenase / fumarate reductase cytochrome b subunit
MKLLPRPVRSSLGSKYVMAVTGFLLIGFVITHMAGNLLLFAGPDALNSYAHALKDKPALLWTARLILLLIFVVHVVLGIRLTLQNKAARPVPYACEDTLQASWASRHMLLTGLVLLAFVIYHLAHFTLGVVPTQNTAAAHYTPQGRVDLHSPQNYLELAETRLPGERNYKPTDKPLGSLDSKKEDVRQDVYSMVIAGFRNPWVSLSYLVAMAFLGLHLWHGGSSWFQSLGLNHPRYNTIIQAIGPLLAIVVVAGNCSIVLSVWLGIVQ